MSSENIVYVKAGANIEWHCNWLQNRSATDLTGISILSQIRDTAGNLIIDFTVEKADQSKNKGSFALKANSTQTATVRPGVYDCDITYTDASGYLVATETFLVEFLKRISKVA